MFVRVLIIVSLAVCASIAADDDSAPEPRHDVIVVTGSYDPVPLGEADRSVRAIDTSGDEELLANTVVDFLHLDPAVDLRQRAPDNIQGDLSIRGSTFGQTLILVDGLRMNDVQTGHHNMNLPVPLDAVETIEVLKGSGSAFYGSDAVGGVVNFRTRAPEVTEVRLRLGLGSFGGNQQRGSVSFARPDWSQQFVFSRDFSTGFRENRDYRNLALTSRTGVRNRLGESSLLLAFSDRPFGADQFYGNFNSWERTKTWFAAARQAFGESTEASFAFRRHTDLFVLYRDRPEVFTNRHQSFSYQGALRRHERLGQNATLHYGGEGLYDGVESNNLGEHARARAAAYVAFDLRALRRFSFTVGGRHEVHGSFNGQFSPTVAAGFWANSRLKLRASVSRAFRLPSFTDLYYHDPANIGSPGLRPESAWSYEGGLDINAGGRWRAELTVFHRRERDGIDYVRTSPADIWRATNFQRLRFTGVEATWTTVVRRVHRIEFHYAALTGAQEALNGLLSKYVFNYPVHSGVAAWQAALPGGLVARTRLGATRRFARDHYAVWDVYIARNAGRIHPYVQLTNLTDTSYQQVMGVQMPPRGVAGGVEIAVFERR